MDYYQFNEKLKHDHERDRNRHSAALERSQVAASQRERLKEIDLQTKLLLDDQQWNRKPEEYHLQHQALIDKLTAELQYIEIELASRRDDQMLCNLLQQIDEALTMRRSLVQQGWSLLIGRLFGENKSEGISPEELELDLQLRAEQLLRK